MEIEILEEIRKLQEAVNARVRLDCVKTPGTDVEKADAERTVRFRSMSLFSAHNNSELMGGVDPAIRGRVHSALTSARQCVAVDPQHVDCVRRVLDEFNIFIWERDLQVSAPSAESVPA